jgi:phage gpG-like protein
MTPEEFQQRLKTLEKEFKEYYDKYAPRIAANTAVKMFKENFQNEGFFGEKWKEVQRRQPGTKAYKAVQKKHPADNSRKILSGRTGDLGRSIEVQTAKDGLVVVWANPAAMQSKAPYGRVHNEGLKAGRGGGFIMPRRQFMGEHPKLNKELSEKLQQKLNETMNKK